MEHIFLVDDNTDLLLMNRILLQRSGYEASTYADGPSALLAAEAKRPAAILLDIGMPPLDGYEVCRRFRAQPWGQQIALLALTGYGKAEDVAAARTAGFDAHLLKPVNLNELLQVLTVCITKRRGELIWSTGYQRLGIPQSATQSSMDVQATMNSLILIKTLLFLYKIDR